MYLPLYRMSPGWSTRDTQSCSSICHCNLLAHLYNYSYRKHSQLVHPMYCYKKTDKCDRSITASPLSYTASRNLESVWVSLKTTYNFETFPSYPPLQLPTCVWEGCWAVCMCMGGLCYVLIPHGRLCACASLLLCTIFSFSTWQTKLRTMHYVSCVLQW